MTALILAGGKGSRLAPWPAPKCLLPINGVPILRRILDHIAPYVERAIVCTGYRAEDIKAAMKHNRLNYHGGVNWLEFSRGGEDDPMCSRLLRAREEKMIEGRVLVCYGDELADVDIHELAEVHEAHRSLLTFATHATTLPFGVVDDDHYIRGDESVIVNIGYAITEPEAWAHMRPQDGLADWANRINSDGRRVHSYLHGGKRASVNNLADLKYAEEVWR